MSFKTYILAIGVGVLALPVFAHAAVDLIAQNISISGTAQEGNVLTFIAEVRNIGTTPTTVQTITKFCVDEPSCITLSTSVVPAEPNKKMPTFRVLTGLAAGSTTSVRSSWGAQPGSHTAYVCADGGLQISETSEANNCATINFTVSSTTLPSLDLFVGGSDGPVSTSSPNLLFSWITRNSPDVCTASGDWSGTKSNTGGSETLSGVSLGSYIYKLYCYGAGQPAKNIIYLRQQQWPTRLYAVFEDLKAQGNFLYATLWPLSGAPNDGNVKLAVFDVSNPQNYFLVGSTTATMSDITNNPSVLPNGNYAYVGARTSVEVYDISNPASPFFVNSFSSGHSGRNSMVKSGNRLYISSENGLSIMDITTPQSPVFMGQETSVTLKELRVSGNYVYGLTYNTDSSAPHIPQVVTYDVSNPASPVVVNTDSVSGPAVITQGWNAGMDRSGNYLYVATGPIHDVLDVFSIATPSNPVFVKSYDFSNYFDNTGWPAKRAVLVSGNYLYIGMINTGIAVFDISNPANPVFAGFTLSSSASADTSALVGKYLYAGSSDRLSQYAQISPDSVSVTVLAGDVDCGIRFQSATITIIPACEPAGTLTSPLRVRKDSSTTFGVILVDPGDASASPLRINTSSGIKAIKKL